MDTLDKHGYFKQQLLKSFPIGRKLYKGLSLRKKCAVIIEEQSFTSSRTAASYYDEMRGFKAMSHPLSGKIMDCFFYQGKESYCWVVLKEGNERLKPGEREWREEELVEFVGNYLDLFDEAQSRHLYYRNVTTNNFLRDDGHDYKLHEFSGYYYLKSSKVYASPLVRSYLAEDEDDLGAPFPFHNPYKSEVYSLGIVAIELALGRYLGSIDPAEVPNLITSLPVSDRMKDILSLLTCEREDQRLEPLPTSLWIRGELDLNDPELAVIRSKRHTENISLIEARYEVTNRVSLLPSQVKYVSCIGCFQTFKISTQSELSEFATVIPLNCVEKNHIFCRPECLMKFAYIETKGEYELIDFLRCPICDYRLPGDVLQGLKEKWSVVKPSIERTVTILRGKCEKNASHSSFHVEMPKEKTSDDIGTVRCLLCNTPEIAVVLHLNTIHGFCSVNCLMEWGRDLRNVDRVEDVPCPVVTCDRPIDPELILSLLPDGMNELRSILHVCEPQRVDTICLGCESVISLNEDYISNTGSRPVFLYCFPPDHAFCSKICMQNYIERVTHKYTRSLSSITCPICDSPIDPNLIYECYDGKANFQSIVYDFTECERESESKQCAQCKVRPGVEVRCGHRYCEDCMTGWSNLVLRKSWKKVIPCLICGEKINVEKYRKHANSIENFLSVAGAKMFG